MVRHANISPIQWPYCSFPPVEKKVKEEEKKEVCVHVSDLKKERRDYPAHTVTRRTKEADKRER